MVFHTPGFPVLIISQSLLKFMSIESVMPSNHFIFCCPLFLLPSIFPSIRVFSNESALQIRWPKYWSFSFSISPSNEYSRLISSRIDWFDLLAVHHIWLNICFNCFSFSMVYFLSVVMYTCESWTIKKPEHRRIDAFQLWCWRRLLRVPWTARRSNQSILKEGNQPWISTGRTTDAEAGALILWPPDGKSWLTGKDPDAGEDWGQEEKGATEDEMVGWHHCLSGHEFE